MKKIKLLITGLVLLFASNLNLVSAQKINTTDSIYNLEVSINNDSIMNLSFYTLYNLDSLKTIYLEAFDGTAEVLNISSLYGRFLAEYYNNTFYSSNFGTITTDSISAGLYKININNTILETTIYKGKKLKFRLSNVGYGYAAPLEIIPTAKSGGWSNYIEYTFDPTTTAIKETVENKQYSYKYFLLSGIETKNPPIGKPIIRCKLFEDKLISTDKIIVTK